MVNRKKIINLIINLYNHENENNPNKLNLMIPAKNNEDYFFKEFKKEIEKSLNNNISDLSLEIDNKKKVVEEKKEEIIKQDNAVDPDTVKKLARVEKKVSEILNLLNMSLYRYKKEDLKNLIITDMLHRYFKTNASEFEKEKIIDAIASLVDNQFRQYESKKEQKRQDMLNSILNTIMPEINNFVEKHSQKGLETLTLLQKENIIKYFIISIENKYLRNEKTIKRINDSDYDFIKNKIKVYIVNRLRQQDEIVKESIL